MPRRTSHIDREMNEALKRARTPGEIVAIKREANLKRRQALSGARDTAPVETGSFRVSLSGPEIEWGRELLFSFGPTEIDLTELRYFRLAFYGEWELPRWPVPHRDSALIEMPQEMPVPGASTQTAANQRAREFLLAHLNDEQRRTMINEGYFIIRAKSGRVWRVRTNTTFFNVDLMDEGGNIIDKFCGRPGDLSLPICDIYLAQKLLLESEDTQFLRVANRF